jgi:hypothetical protein
MNFSEANMECNQQSASLVDISSQKQIEWLVKRFRWVLISRMINTTFVALWTLSVWYHLIRLNRKHSVVNASSLAEFKWPASLLKLFIYRTSFWTGYTNNGNSTAYYWPDGNRVTNVNLMTGQSARGDCIVINRNEQWETTDCEEKNNVVCSLDVPYGKMIVLLDFMPTEICVIKYYVRDICL